MRPSLLKKAPTLLILCGLATGLLAGCVGEDNPKPQPPALESPVPTATVTISNPAQPTRTGMPTSLEPVIALSANSSRDAELLQGWPLLLEVSLMHPDYLNTSVAVEPVTVGTESKPWTGALSLEVVDEEGKSQSWPMQPAGAPAGLVTLDSEAFSTAYWMLGPEQTARLQEGAYTVAAHLDTSSFSGGWQGNLSSVPATIRVEKAPARLSPEQESTRAQMLAGHASLLGKRSEAMSYLDELLADQPDNIGALEFKGDLLAEEGKASEALDAYNQAIKTFYEQNDDPQEAPTILAQKQHAMMDKLLETR